MSTGFQIPFNITDEWIESRYNHVHHGRVLSILEHARIELLKSIGMPNEMLLDRGDALVITRIEVQYKREVRVGAVTVTCEEPAIENREIVLKQRLLNDKGKELLVAKVHSMFLSTTLKKGIQVPDDFKLAFNSWGQSRIG